MRTLCLMSWVVWRDILCALYSEQFYQIRFILVWRGRFGPPWRPLMNRFFVCGLHWKVFIGLDSNLICTLILMRKLCIMRFFIFRFIVGCHGRGGYTPLTSGVADLLDSNIHLVMFLQHIAYINVFTILLYNSIQFVFLFWNTYKTKLDVFSI